MCEVENVNFRVLRLFNEAFSFTQGRYNLKDEITIVCGQIRVCKEMVVACLKILTPNVHEVAKKYQEPTSDWKLTPAECNSRDLRLQ
jgi:hypothetical protein